MVASEHTSQIATPGRSTAGVGGHRAADGGPTAESHTTATAQLRQPLDRAEALSLRAPELARVLAERVAVLAESAGANAVWIHAESLAVLTAVRLGYRAETTGRAVTVLRAAEDAHEHVLAVRLRAALAVCARSVGAPLTGLAALRHALSESGVPGAHRATALCQLARCVSGVAGKAELDKTFATADRLCTADSTLTADTRLVRRALLRIGMSVHRRRYGDIVGAADAARTGIGFLDGLDDGATDGGVARARLSLELVTSSLDRGESAVALEVAGPSLSRPLRAAEVAPVAWLRLAIATRVHLAAGEGYAATRLLRDALRDTDRHGMRSLSAQLRSELAHVEERMGRTDDALEILRDARADERADARVRAQAHAILTSEFDGARQPELDLGEILAEQPTDSAAAHVAEPGSPAADTSVQPPAHDTPAVDQQPVQQTVHPDDNKPAERVGAGSVLDRLGITVGSRERGGGRRRAADPELDDPSRKAESGEYTAASEASGQDVPAGSDETSQRPGDDAAASRVGEDTADESVADRMDWLPKLRLPPSLAPVEELYATDRRDEQPGESGNEPAGADQSTVSDPAPSPGAAAPGDDNSAPDPEAGLAELLTRAMAEHQSGRSSAATLVARLESGTMHSDDTTDETAPSNGRHRSDG